MLLGLTATCLQHMSASCGLLLPFPFPILFLSLPYPLSFRLHDCPLAVSRLACLGSWKVTCNLKHPSHRITHALHRHGPSKTTLAPAETVLPWLSLPCAALSTTSACSRPTIHTPQHDTLCLDPCPPVFTPAHVAASPSPVASMVLCLSYPLASLGSARVPFPSAEVRWPSKVPQPLSWLG